jgi:hypothetical protein
VLFFFSSLVPLLSLFLSYLIFLFLVPLSWAMHLGGLYTFLDC